MREGNPEASSLINVEQSKIEELRQNLQKACECEMQAQEEKESLHPQLMDVNSWLEELKQLALLREEQKNSLRRATELRNTTGRLQLELKGALNEKELCEY